jgi:PAS domain-containing protein
LSAHYGNANQMVKLLEQVRGANEHYRALFFNSAKDAIALLSPDGIVLDANDRWGELLDVPAASLVGITFAISRPGA